MFTSSSIDHSTSIMTTNAKAHSAFLPQGLELVPMTQFQSKLCTWPLSMKTITIETEPLETMLPQASPRRKIGIKKKLTPKKLQVAAASPSSPASPASNTRSKKKLQLQ